MPYQAYQRAIARAVKRKQEEDGEAHCLDIGTGSGLLAVMAAQAGASSVVAAELHDSLAAVARRVRPGMAPGTVSGSYSCCSLHTMLMLSSDITL